jgi:hypothetical protein
LGVVCFFAFGPRDTARGAQTGADFFFQRKKRSKNKATRHQKLGTSYFVLENRFRNFCHVFLFCSFVRLATMRASMSARGAKTMKRAVG